MNEPRVVCVITSINPPTEAMLSWSDLEELIVVPDQRTPLDAYEGSGIELLSQQLTHGLDLIRHNHYSRKMIGYLEAVTRNADLILDTDDDTFLSSTCQVLDHSLHKQRLLVGKQSPFINLFAFRLGEFNIWPRGFPLDEVRSQNQISIFDFETTTPVSVVQFFINGDTDVDAVQRLVYGIKDVQFPITSTLDIIGRDYFCPFNSQLTLWNEQSFPLLYLPSTVTFRFTDILRGIVAKRVMDANGLLMGFADSIGYQIRNEHDYMLDFKSEVPCYLQTREAWNCLVNLKSRSVEGGLMESYERLIKKGICQEDELELVKLWLTRLNELSVLKVKS
jgi:hypothetical protein